MKLPCEMIRDLLPLYHDGVCSEVSKTIVAEHLKTCENCGKTLKNLETELSMPRLDADEGKPMKSIKRKWRTKTWILGLLIGLAVFFVWFQMTQNWSVPLTPEDYEITNVVQFSNGMYYLEYQIPYNYRGLCADLLRTEDGSVYFQEYRPALSWKDREGGMVRSELIDPANHRTDMGEEIPMKAFYLGAPDSEDALLLWSAEEEYPMATPEMEREQLYRNIFR